MRLPVVVAYGGVVAVVDGGVVVAVVDGVVVVAAVLLPIVEDISRTVLISPSNI